jgi:Radical SAM superfamily
MYISHNELLWILRQVDGQRIDQNQLIRMFANHGIYSLLPYFNGIESIFEKSDDRLGVVKNVFLALEARINHKINCPESSLIDMSYRDFEKYFSQIIIQSLQHEDFSTLEKGARVYVGLDSDASYIQPGSEGFITEKLYSESKVIFYSIAGRRGTDLLSIEIPDEELQVLNVNNLLGRHQDFSGVAQYFFNDSMLRSMRSSIDSSVYSFTANLAVKFLIDEGFLKIEGEDFFSVPSRIFSVRAPKLDKTYRDESLFSSHSLSSPPSERKPHVLRLELTTGCDYNRCTFCTEYSGMEPVTKSFDEFRDHIVRVVDSIGSEKSRIQRLFIGSGNSLGVDTELLLESLSYASAIFNPLRISLYGRTASILEKSVDELKRLKDTGLSMIYWGLESGSDEVLKYVCKDCTRNEIIEASKMLAEAEIEASGMLMPGVGGLRLSEEHVVGSLELLQNIDLSYLTLLSINPCENSLYAKNMKSEMDNRNLTPDEVNAQVYKLLEGLKPTGLQIGMFTEEVDQVSSNTMRFNYEVTAYNKELLLRDFWK